MSKTNNKIGGNYNYWIPEILKISNIYEVDKNNGQKRKKENHNFWDFYKKINTVYSLEDSEAGLTLSKTNYINNSKKHFQWNYLPNMVIDLDWFKSNQKKIYNIILTEENND